MNPPPRMNPDVIKQIQDYDLAKQWGPLTRTGKPKPKNEEGGYRRRRVSRRRVSRRRGSRRHRR